MDIEYLISKFSVLCLVIKPQDKERTESNSWRNLLLLLSIIIFILSFSYYLRVDIDDLPFGD